MADNSPMIHPKPLRPPSFTVTSSSTPSTPSTPADANSDTFVSRTRSVLNLTSSTLFGIYAPADSDSNSTPWGVGSQTPLPRASTDEDKRPPVIGAFEKPGFPRRQSLHHQPDTTRSLISRLGTRTILLFCFGVAYGIIISHLHDSRRVAPVQVQGLERSWVYLLGWGAVAVLLGGLTPWVDILWEDVLGINKDVFPSDPRGNETSNQKDEDTGRPTFGTGADWNPVVRSIGAFVGIAFAIRKLPWQSTLQVSLTLALVNPVLWYLVDRSKPGFILSTFVGLLGTAIVFGVNPDIVPSPATPSPKAGVGTSATFGGRRGLHSGLISNETIGVSTWVASVLFCSSVCFGNIGRRLALGTREKRTNIS